MTEGARPRRAPLAWALAAVALSFLPFVGVAVAAAALVLVGRDRRAGRTGAGVLAIAVLGAVLSAGYTAGYVACAPSRETADERRTWREFDRLFEPVSPQDRGNAQGNSQPPPAGP